jgi:riboflavin kinase/FMN adenylyltransferase
VNIVHQPAELHAGSRKVCIAVGVFDGVHLGHQQVIRQAIADADQQEALSVLVTFDRHPNEVVAPDRVPPLIYLLPKRLSVIASLGVRSTLLLHFDRTFSQIPAEEFVRDLIRDLGHVYSLCVGSEFTFGFRRQGNVPLLKRLGHELGFLVHGLAAVSLDGEVVSSTRIREAIQKGDLDAASQMLGRPYALSAKVVHGDHLGRQLGVPTANLDVIGLALPPNGVYAIHAVVASQSHRGVLNIGFRPTLQSPTPRLQVEAHLLDFAGELYGHELEVTFVQKLRDEQKFPSVDALKVQIARDIAAALQIFS